MLLAVDSVWGCTKSDSNMATGAVCCVQAHAHTMLAIPLVSSCCCTGRSSWSRCCSSCFGAAECAKAGSLWQSLPARAKAAESAIASIGPPGSCSSCCSCCSDPAWAKSRLTRLLLSGTCLFEVLLANSLTPGRSSCCCRGSVGSSRLLRCRCSTAAQLPAAAAAAAWCSMPEQDTCPWIGASSAPPAAVASMPTATAAAGVLQGACASAGGTAAAAGSWICWLPC